MTQKQAILDYIMKFGSITPIQAFDDLGITKLATRISELKRDGVHFDVKMVNHVNRYGSRTKYNKYSLKGENVYEQL